MRFSRRRPEPIEPEAEFSYQQWIEVLHRFGAGELVDASSVRPLAASGGPHELARLQIHCYEALKSRFDRIGVEWSRDMQQVTDPGTLERLLIQQRRKFADIWHFLHYAPLPESFVTEMSDLVKERITKEQSELERILGNNRDSALRLLPVARRARFTLIFSSERSSGSAPQVEGTPQRQLLFEDKGT